MDDVAGKTSKKYEDAISFFAEHAGAARAKKKLSIVTVDRDYGKSARPITQSYVSYSGNAFGLQPTHSGRQAVKAGPRCISAVAAT